MPSIPESKRKMVSLDGVSKKPVPLTRDNFDLVHEHRDYSATIRVEFGEEFLKAEFPSVDERWSGH